MLTSSGTNISRATNKTTYSPIDQKLEIFAAANTQCISPKAAIKSGEAKSGIHNHNLSINTIQKITASTATVATYGCNRRLRNSLPKPKGLYKQLCHQRARQMPAIE